MTARRRATADAERTARAFGVKDLFTAFNIACGTLAIAFCVEGEVLYAAYAFLVGYFFGDALDGTVARLTNTENRFGGQLDQIGDHLAQCVVPAAMVFTFFHRVPVVWAGRDLSFPLATGLAMCLMISGSIRHARSTTAAMNFPLAWVGMPRTVSAMLVISYLNSANLARLPRFELLGALLVVAVSIANLVPLPYRTHRGRALRWAWAKVLVAAFFVTTVGALLVVPQQVFDVAFAWLVGYSALSWTELTRDERREFFERTRAWSLELRAR